MEEEMLEDVVVSSRHAQRHLDGHAVQVLRPSRARQLHGGDANHPLERSLCLRAVSGLSVRARQPLGHQGGLVGIFRDGFEERLRQGVRDMDDDDTRGGTVVALLQPSALAIPPKLTISTSFQSPTISGACSFMCAMASLQETMRTWATVPLGRGQQPPVSTACKSTSPSSTSRPHITSVGREHRDSLFSFLRAAAKTHLCPGPHRPCLSPHPSRRTASPLVTSRSPQMCTPQPPRTAAYRGPRRRPPARQSPPLSPPPPAGPPPCSRSGTPPHST